MDHEKYQRLVDMIYNVGKACLILLKIISGGGKSAHPRRSKLKQRLDFGGGKGWPDF
jgi:hypothetical protein